MTIPREKRYLSTVIHGLFALTMMGDVQGKSSGDKGFKVALLTSGPVTDQGSKTGKNVASIDFAFGDGAYLAGIVAGANTKTGTIGVMDSVTRAIRAGMFVVPQ